MTADDMTIRCTVVPTTEKDNTNAIWKAKTTVFNDIVGYGDDIDEALVSFTENLRKLYQTGALKLTNPNLEIGYTITQASAVIGLGVNPNKSLADYEKEDIPCSQNCRECPNEDCNSRQEEQNEADEEFACSNCLQKQQGECPGKEDNKICTHYAAKEDEEE